MKHQNINNIDNLNPVVVRGTASKETSIYESIVAMGVRARQINDDIKMQIQARMAHINPVDDDTETTNYDQLAISKEFDSIARPSFLAMQEILQGKLHHRIEVSEKK